jgi:alginate O-acetyltransferase complex protein AlgJ
LRARGIHLLVVPIPSKAAIYPELLERGYDPRRGPRVNSDHGKWIEQLRRGGADVFDPTELMWAHRYDPQGYVFHPTDTHWTFRAMDMTAAVIAEKIRPMLSDVAPARKFQTRVMRYDRPGDLFGREGVIPAKESSGGIHEDRVQLFDDNGVVICGNEAPVLVIGDSFAEFFASHGSGLAQTIMRHLGADVQSAAVMGGRGDSMRQMLNRPGILEKKRVVVFAFAIRQIVTADEWHPMRIGG